eukprot:Lankesteria_metandrocarpae@DN9330_c0_g1_i1.p1
MAKGNISVIKGDFSVEVDTDARNGAAARLVLQTFKTKSKSAAAQSGSEKSSKNISTSDGKHGRTIKDGLEATVDEDGREEGNPDGDSDDEDVDGGGGDVVVAAAKDDDNDTAGDQTTSQFDELKRAQSTIRRRVAPLLRKLLFARPGAVKSGAQRSHSSERVLR